MLISLTVPLTYVALTLLVDGAFGIWHMLVSDTDTYYILLIDFLKLLPTSMCRYKYCVHVKISIH